MKLDRWALAAGLSLIALLLVAALAAPLIAPHDPYAISMKSALKAPGGEYPLGTDQLGRCVFSRLLYGARNSLGIACLVLAVTFSIGTVIGTISGLFAGRLPDKILTALCEVTLAFPGILLALVVSSLLGPGVMNIMLAIALVSWARYARLVRSLTIGIREADYIKAARVAGTRGVHIVTRHILPGIMGTLATAMVTDIGSTILRLAGLSFIGLGAQPPEAEWGVMINEARLYIDAAPWLILCPVIAVSIAVLAFHLAGDGLKARGGTQ